MLMSKNYDYLFLNGPLANQQRTHFTTFITKSSSYVLMSIKRRGKGENTQKVLVKLRKFLFKFSTNFLTNFIVKAFL